MRILKADHYFPNYQLSWNGDVTRVIKCVTEVVLVMSALETRRLLCKHRGKFSLFTSFSLFLESWGVYTTVLPLDETNKNRNFSSFVSFMGRRNSNMAIKLSLLELWALLELKILMVISCNSPKLSLNHSLTPESNE